uniref:PEBP-like protein n=1 Tax=Paecilomyces divaricatus TaxID=644132 RepID=A0A3G1IHJ6_PAEDI|nr:PEBP-like protein [Paecilomyces divaricatus]
MRPDLWLLLALVCLPLIAAQTPPGYWPKTPRGLDVIFRDQQLIQPGQLVLPDDAIDPPVFGRQGLSVFQSYLAVMIDVEVNHEGTATPLVHWLQPDLKVRDPFTGRLARLSDEDVPYVGPRPVPGPRHTYVLLLFEQPTTYRFPECFSSTRPISVDTRSGFNLAQFMHVAGLQEPIAASYFTARNEETPSAPPPRVTTTSLSTAPCATPTRFVWC